jgi:hypothetical protein
MAAIVWWGTIVPRVENLQQGLSDMKADFADIKADVKASLADMKASNERLEADMKAGFADIKADVKASLADMKASNEKMEAKLSTLSRAFYAVVLLGGGSLATIMWQRLGGRGPASL